MRTTGRFVVVDGKVDHIIGSHDTTDVNITEQITTHPDDGPYSADPFDQRRHGFTRTETHTFVNTSREFAMLFEVNGHTLKLASADYIALATGDSVRAVCERVPDCPLLVLDWSNRTRGIRWRALPSPLAGAASEIGGSLVLLAIGIGAVFLWRDFDGSILPPLIGGGAVVLAGLAAIGAYRRADGLARTHAELDRLT
jgi:hypothetical protein